MDVCILGLHTFNREPFLKSEYFFMFLNVACIYVCVYGCIYCMYVLWTAGMIIRFSITWYRCSPDSSGKAQGFSHGDPG